MWYEMTGECKMPECANAVADNQIEDRHPSLRFYFFVIERNRNNLPDDDIAVAIEQGRIQVVQGVETILTKWELGGQEKRGI